MRGEVKREEVGKGPTHQDQGPHQGTHPRGGSQRKRRGKRGRRGKKRGNRGEDPDQEVGEGQSGNYSLFIHMCL